jgi:hypothetical protein
MACAECNNHQCSTPECCEDINCTDNNKPFCDQDEQVCVGCENDNDCPDYDGTCSNDYTIENSDCFYCHVEDDNKYGSCESGCADDNNCPSGELCDGSHRCNEQGSFVALENVMIDTEFCDGCSAIKEDGVIINLKGKYDSLDCLTNQLDHEDVVDYVPGGRSEFTERGPLGGCYLVSI